MPTFSDLVLGAPTVLIEPTPDEDFEKDIESTLDMNIKTTKISRIIKYGVLPVPTQEQHAENIFHKVVKQCKSIVTVPRFPLISRGKDVLVGIEIELESYPMHKTLDTVDPLFTVFNGFLQTLWTSTQDHSLRNHGIEFISRPLKGEETPYALATLNMWLGSFAKEIAINYRCGTHVHLDVRDLTVEQYINLVSLYILFEDTFYRISGERWKNQYCVPLRDSASSVEKLFALVHNSKPTFKDFRNIFHSFKKYMACNLLPTGKNVNHPHKPPLGTIEFRHHKGEHQPSVLVPWIQALLDIHTVATKYSFQELQKQIFALNTESNYLQFAKAIFHEPLVNQKDLIRDMYEGSTCLKELYVMAEND